MDSRGANKLPTCVMHTEIAVTDRVDGSTSDERWAVWVAKGLDNERRTKKRAIAAAAVISGGLGLSLAIFLVLG